MSWRRRLQADIELMRQAVQQAPEACLENGGRRILLGVVIMLLSPSVPRGILMFVAAFFGLVLTVNGFKSLQRQVRQWSKN